MTCFKLDMSGHKECILVGCAFLSLKAPARRSWMRRLFVFTAAAMGCSLGKHPVATKKKKKSMSSSLSACSRIGLNSSGPMASRALPLIFFGMTDLMPCRCTPPNYLREVLSLPALLLLLLEGLDLDRLLLLRPLLGRPLGSAEESSSSESACRCWLDDVADGLGVLAMGGCPCMMGWPCMPTMCWPAWGYIIMLLGTMLGIMLLGTMLLGIMLLGIIMLPGIIMLLGIIKLPVGMV